MGKETNCWRCKKGIDRAWEFCPFCSARLRDTRTPTPPQGKRDVLFLQDLYSFGWYNRDITAMVLYDSVADIMRYYDPNRVETDRPLIEPDRAQKILRTKLFAELLALLEGFGVLCLSIRERKRKSVLWTFLNAEPQEVTQFYQQVLSSSQTSNVKRLLNLPSRTEIEKAVSSFPSSPLADIQDLNKQYESLGTNIRVLAELYRDNVGANVRIYNKVKHVFSIIDGQRWVEPPVDPEMVAVLVEDTGLVGRLPMSQERANMEINNIRVVTLMGAELLALSIALHRLNLLL